MYNKIYNLKRISKSLTNEKENTPDNEQASTSKNFGNNIQFMI